MRWLVYKKNLQTGETVALRTCLTRGQAIRCAKGGQPVYDGTPWVLLIRRAS